jgi:hypothetical protein
MTETVDLAAAKELLAGAYEDFNARRLDAVLARLHPEVEWANGMEGGHVYGRGSVRAYWARQWATINPRVDPTAFAENEHGGLTAEVHQVVRDLQGTLLADRIVHHVYQFADGLIKRMDIV